MSTLNLRKLLVGIALGTSLAVPSFAVAQDHRRHDDHRQDHDRNRNDDRRDRERAEADRRRAEERRRDRDRRNDTSHRQSTKNTWRNVGLASGAAGVFGLITGNKTLAALGIGGGLYSASRYEADRKSQNRDDHRRYELFNRSSFDHNGHHYERRTKTVNGQRNYYFTRTR